jgi:hypothetical protein
VDEDFLKRLDEWRRKQDDVASGLVGNPPAGRARAEGEGEIEG